MNNNNYKKAFSIETTWKGKYLSMDNLSMDNTKIGIERGNSYQKNEQIPG